MAFFENAYLPKPKYLKPKHQSAAGIVTITLPMGPPYRIPPWFQRFNGATGAKIMILGELPPRPGFHYDDNVKPQKGLH
jgi:hypothetical protein